MIFYKDDKLTIRNMEQGDVQPITDGEIAQGYNSTAEKYEMRLKDQRDKKCVSMTAEYCGSAVGYINLYFEPLGGAFLGKGYPEIVDFGVLEKYRRLGIGGRLMDAAENLAAEYSDTVCIGVGLHYGYGSAQRMYVKRGYIPDGSGVWYKDSVCEHYADCCNDDDLVLYLSKKLR